MSDPNDPTGCSAEDLITQRILHSPPLMALREDTKIKDIPALLDGHVIARFETSADNTGALNGIPPTGQRLTFCEVHLMRFEDRKLVENWVGALNPLTYEIWPAPAIAASPLGETP